MKPKFQYFLYQNSNVYLEKDDRQFSGHVNTIFRFFFGWFIGIFMRYTCLKSGQLQRPTYRKYGYYLIKEILMIFLEKDKRQALRIC